MIADMITIPVFWTKTSATLGAAIIASVGVGLHNNMNVAVKEMVPSAIETDPDQEASKEYADLGFHYFRLRDRITKLYD